LWDLDFQRLVPGVDYEIQLQSDKKPYAVGDSADLPLFKYVKPDVLQRPLWSAFIALLDNYEAAAGQAERVTRQEEQENARFLSEVFKNPCMKYAHRYLVKKGKAPANETQFKNQLLELWFGLYRRVVENDSSGFEHVFVGESKNGKIVGLHNWIQMYKEECTGNLNYLGYIKPRRHGGGYQSSYNHEQLITIQFEWGGEIKPESSSFIGVSPAFEFALYTMCFLLGQEKSLVQVGSYMIEVTAYNMKHRGKNYIGTSFPAATDKMTPDQGATVIQSKMRGRLASRKNLADVRDQKKQVQAATKIQARSRGRKSRKQT